MRFCSYYSGFVRMYASVSGLLTVGLSSRYRAKVQEGQEGQVWSGSPGHDSCAGHDRALVADL